jgi:hypothetical protein
MHGTYIKIMDETVSLKTSNTPITNIRKQNPQHVSIWMYVWTATFQCLNWHHSIISINAWTFKSSGMLRHVDCCTREECFARVKPGWAAWPWRRHYASPKRQKLFTSRRGVNILDDLNLQQHRCENLLSLRLQLLRLFTMHACLR